LYKPTKKDCKFWFNYYNELLFDHKLKQFRKIKFTKFQKECYLGWCIGYISPKRKIRYSKLILTPEFTSIDLFKITLIHEMVHHYQWLFHKVINHGKTFTKWKEKVEKLTTYELSERIPIE